ncbi:septum formation inhibitor Maf [Candidatus Dependentiae bacterium]|nr:septum formation inhibitor Maf [Candidatus Dependentiae bacterium]
MRKLILASSSPRRKKILTDLGLQFEVIPPEISEEVKPNESPKDFAIRCSTDKAKEVAKKHNGIIISADTIVVLENKIIGKPKDKDDAVQILKSLSGKKHQVITGITLFDSESQKLISDFVQTDVWITKLNDDDIEKYINTFEPSDKAGAYAAQGKGAVLVERVDGDFFNVVGLPVFKLYKLLKEFNIDLLKYPGNAQ